MKFSCERCQTRYSIGDEKVKGKVLKIRCKTCGNIIVVREQLPTVQGEASGFALPQQREAAMAAVGAGPQPTNPSLSLSNSGAQAQQAQQAQRSAPPQRAAAGADFDWYVAIKGQQHGPAKAADVVRLYKDGRISERTYLWHDQLPSWTRLKDLPEFAAALAEGPGPKRPPPPPPSEEGAEIVNFEAARAQRQAQSPGAVTNDPFAGVQGVPGVGGDNAPRESTRVFIMQAGLHNRSQKQRLYAGVAVLITLSFVLLCVVDYQLDILGLKSVVNAVAVSTGIKEAPVVEPSSAWDSTDAEIAKMCEGKPNPGLCVKGETARLVAQRCLLMPDPLKCEKEQNSFIVAKRKKRALASGKPLTDADLDGAFNSGGSGSGSGVVAHNVIDDNGMVAVGTGLTADEINKKLGGGKGGPAAPKLTIGTPDVAGTPIDAENAGKVVREGQPAIQACVDDAMKNGEDIPGKVRITLSIMKNGVVERAVVNDAVVQAGSLGGCMTKAAKRWKFAPPGEPADLEIPLVLR